MRENRKERFRERSISQEGGEEERAREIEHEGNKKKSMRVWKRESGYERVGAMCRRN